MSVYKPKGRKHYSYDFQIRGTRFRGGTRCTTRKAAEEVQRQARNQAAVELASGISRKKPLRANQAFSRYYKEKAVDQPSAKDTDRQLATLTEFFGADATLTELADPDKIAEYIAQRRSKVKDASVNREVQLLRRVLRRAANVWKRETGPLPDWSQLILKEPQGRTRELTEEEEAALFKHLRADFHPLFRFALMTGLRLKALTTLTWRQVDWDAGQIRVRLKSHTPDGTEHVLPITPPMRAFLQGLRGQHPIYVFTYVCAKSRGMRKRGERYPYTKNGWRKDFKAATKAAEIEDYRFHDNRHTAATRLLRRTRNLKLAQRMLGHASIQSTVRYAHVTTDDLSQGMEEMQRHQCPVRESPEADKPLKEGSDSL